MANDVEKLIQNFAAELQALVRAQLSEEVNGAVRAALGSGSPGRAAKGSKAPTSRRLRNGGRRSPEEIEKQAEKVLAYIVKNPEQRSEQIAEATDLSTKDLVGPLKKLLAGKKIKANGKARGTTYKPVG